MELSRKILLFNTRLLVELPSSLFLKRFWMRFLNILTAVILTFFLSACSSQQNASNDKIRISTNSWIGYAPLFYAKETGELDRLGFSLITNVSLAEAADVYQVGKADMVTTTQHEYHALKELMGDVTPIILLDRSNGGDMILANVSLDVVKTAPKVTVYLEVDSINVELLQEFIQKNHIDQKKLSIINEDQQKIQDVQNSKSPTLIVTYTPYDVSLKKKGFKEIASTRNIHELVVIDALCARKRVIEEDKDRLVALKRVIDKKIELIQKDPKRSFGHVKKYLGNMNYEDYIASLQSIKWINHPSKELLEVIDKMGYKEKDLIK